MAKIFSEQAELNNHPARNNFDLSHKVHMSGKMGVLYPNFCKPVVPGDTFRISSGCAINFMPMPYPTQTRMRFIQHFFYVRNKNIWENWENWLQGLEEHVPPYIDQPKEFYETGSLADFLGIPTERVEIENRGESSLFEKVVLRLGPDIKFMSSVGINDYLGREMHILNDYDNYFRDGSANISANVVYLEKSEHRSRFATGERDFLMVPSVTFARKNMMSAGSMTLAVYAAPDFGEEVSNVDRYLQSYYFVDKVCDWRVDQGSIHDLDDSFSGTFFIDRVTLPQSALVGVNSMLDNLASMWSASNPRVLGVKWKFGFILPAQSLSPEFFQEGEPEVYFYAPDSEGGQPRDEALVTFRANVSAVDGLNTSNPYYFSGNQEVDTIRISALPFRAYESIYNAYYRNQHGNQPFIVDGQTKYNVYNTTKADGADSTPYKLMFRNWELDAYTSALPSPQQGPAPLVGISALGRVTIVDPETGVTTTAQATDTANGIQISDVELGEAGHQRYLVNLAQSGITINDFRQVNALQRFLETNIRKGFRYVDFIEGHFGHRIKDAVMDMPEFIGGYSENVNVNMVTNTAQQPNAALGDYAGQASAFGGSSHSITHFCDDYGFIIGIVCLVPDPTYSQILPKYFNVKNPLDYYFPEFSQIGLQPITYEELCPIQSHAQYLADGTSKLTDVFGYQRPNHDMVWYPDTIHGEFRKTFNPFLVNRLFTKRPVLGNDFLVIKPEETNNIFTYTRGDDDVFVGQFAFDVKAKRPLPRIVIPGLGH